jgi:drug/metabolite transporter (DMT)-like permease
MAAVLLALIAAVSFSASDYTAGLATRRASVVRVTLVTEVTHAALLWLVIPFASRQAPSLPALAWGAAAGISGLAGAMALYLGFRHAAFSVASSISAVGSATFATAAGLLFGERPSTLSLAGIALALPAIAGVSASPGGRAGGQPGHDGNGGPGGGPGPSAAPDGAPPASPGRGIRGHAAGVMWGLVAGAAFGLYFISLNQAGSATDVWPLGAAGVTALLVVGGLAAATRQLRLPPPGARWLAVATGATAAVGTFSFFLATHRGLLAVTAIITSLYPAGTILLARVLSGERLTVTRIAGLGLAALSVVLIAVGGAG